MRARFWLLSVSLLSACSAIVPLLGAERCTGDARFQGCDEALGQVSLLCDEGVLIRKTCAADELCIDPDPAISRERDGARAADDGCGIPIRCGDGNLDTNEGEECDDGNGIDTDGCRSNCLLNVCGDGVINFEVENCEPRGEGNCNEQCRLECESDDDCQNDPLLSDNACVESVVCSPDKECVGVPVPLPPGSEEDCVSEGCIPALGLVSIPLPDGSPCLLDGVASVCQAGSCRVEGECGDGVLQSGEGETCDDGNLLNGDGCDASCQQEGDTCGDGDINGAEQCDDSNDDNLDSCKNDCTFNVCGDGILRLGVEECDDNNLSNGDGCSSACVFEFSAGAVCGDGFPEGSEQCDDGNTTNGDGCSSSCTIETVTCGNNIVETGEECDDGNIIPGDGCDAGCFSEVAGNVCSNFDNETIVLGNNSIPGSTVGTINNLNGSCIQNSGAEDIYILSFDPLIAPNESIEFLLTPGPGVDLGMYARARCDTANPELFCRNAVGLSGPETITLSGVDLASAKAGFALIVDTAGGSSPGQYNLQITRSLASCGNGVIDAGEECDNANFGGQSCVTQGFSGGTLSCDTLCQIETNGCFQSGIDCSNTVITPFPLPFSTIGNTNTIPFESKSQVTSPAGSCQVGAGASTEDVFRIENNNNTPMTLSVQLTPTSSDHVLYLKSQPCGSAPIFLNNCSNIGGLNVQEGLTVGIPANTVLFLYVDLNTGTGDYSLLVQPL